MYTLNRLFTRSKVQTTFHKPMILSPTLELKKFKLDWLK